MYLVFKFELRDVTEDLVLCHASADVAVCCWSIRDARGTQVSTHKVAGPQCLVTVVRRWNRMVALLPARVVNIPRLLGDSADNRNGGTHHFKPPKVAPVFRPFVEATYFRG